MHKDSFSVFLAMPRLFDKVEDNDPRDMLET